MSTLQLDPLKRLKLLLLSPPTKVNPLLNPTLMKTILAICIFTGFFICYFSLSKELTRQTQSTLHVINKLITKEEKTSLSHIFFGIGGAAETWAQRRRYTELWWKPNVTRGHVWLDRDPINFTELQTSPSYKVSADTSSFTYTCSYGSRSAVRIARIIKETFELGLPNVRWFVMGDDDTVFFLENLLFVLNKYDHKEMYYIGSNSESVEQDVIHSYTMGYGGGGFAISYPLAAELVKVLDGCINRYAELYGSDEKIGGCMAEIGVPLTRELGFHQVDIRGDPYGFLSAHPLAPLVSLHHLDYVDPLFPDTDRIASVQTLINAYNSDPSRTLQHTFFHDLTRNWSVSVSWGYTVQLYPYLVTARDLRTPLQTFSTWRTWSLGPFAFNTRVNSLNPCERPIVYMFDGVEEFGNGSSTLTRYKRSRPDVDLCDRDDYKAAYLVQGFNVTAPIFDLQLWNKAPRRQCGEVINGKVNGTDHNGVLQVNIRGCNQFESVTPP